MQIDTKAEPPVAVAHTAVAVPIALDEHICAAYQTLTSTQARVAEEQARVA